MSVLDWVSHADWTCSEQLLRSKLVPFPRPGSSALSHSLPLPSVWASLSTHTECHRALLSTSPAAIYQGQKQGLRDTYTWCDAVHWGSKISQLQCLSGLRQGDSKCAGSLSKCPAYSPGNRDALLAHRLEETWPAQRYGIFVLFVCCPWKTQHWGPLGFAKSLNLAPKAGYWASSSSAGIGSSPEGNYASWAEIITQLPCHWNLSFSPDTANKTTYSMSRSDLSLHQCGRLLLIFSWWMYKFALHLPCRLTYSIHLPQTLFRTVKPLKAGGVKTGIGLCMATTVGPGQGDLMKP